MFKINWSLRIFKCVRISHTQKILICFCRLKCPSYYLLFLLSEHMLYKESIVIVKVFDFEILTYSYALRPLVFIYAIFMVMYVSMYVCMHMYVCMRVNTIVSKRCIQLSSNLVCTLRVTVERTLLILLKIGCIVFLQEYKKDFLYITVYVVKFLKVFQYPNGAFDWAQI